MDVVGHYGLCENTHGVSSTRVQNPARHCLHVRSPYASFTPPRVPGDMRKQAEPPVPWITHAPSVRVDQPRGHAPGFGVEGSPGARGLHPHSSFTSSFTCGPE